MKRSLKQKRNLERRIADYARMMNDPNSPARRVVDYRYRVKPPPHKWQAVMDAFKEGKACQWRNPLEEGRKWRDLNPMEYIGWYDDFEYRIKPEPVVKYGMIGEAVYAGLTRERGPMDNIKLTFEDGKLIAAEVLK